MIDRLDKDGDSVIQLSETRPQQGARRGGNVGATFARADIDGDGMLSVAEYKATTERSGRRGN